MKLFETIGRGLRFDEPDGRFELLETEPGQPSFFHGRKRSEPPETPDMRAVPGRLKESRRRLEEAFFHESNPDLILREFRFCGSVNALAAFLNGMADGNALALSPWRRTWRAPPSWTWIRRS